MTYEKGWPSTEATLHAFQRRQVPCGIVTAGGRMVGSFTVDPGIEASLTNLVEGGEEFAVLLSTRDEPSNDDALSKGGQKIIIMLMGGSRGGWREGGAKRCDLGIDRGDDESEEVRGSCRRRLLKFSKLAPRCSVTRRVV